MCRGKGQAIEIGGRGRTPIRFGNYNIRDGQNGGLESALREMGQSKVDVGVFQEIKLTYGIYARGSAGYNIVATLVPRRHRNGVALFYWDSPAFAVEAIHQFGVNAIACQLATGGRCWYIIRCYVASGDDTTIRDVEAEMAERPRGMELIVAGDFDMYL